MAAASKPQSRLFLSQPNCKNCVSPPEAQIPGRLGGRPQPVRKPAESKSPKTGAQGV